LIGITDPVARNRIFGALIVPLRDAFGGDIAGTDHPAERLRTGSSDWLQVHMRGEAGGDFGDDADHGSIEANFLRKAAWWRGVVSFSTTATK
jgi:hypothetical protein